MRTRQNEVDGRPELEATSVCLIRIEGQPSGLLITVRVNYDITNVPVDTTFAVDGPEAALAAVRDFLERASGKRLEPPYVV